MYVFIFIKRNLALEGFGGGRGRAICFGQWMKLEFPEFVAAANVRSLRASLNQFSTLE